MEAGRTLFWQISKLAAQSSFRALPSAASHARLSTSAAAPKVTRRTELDYEELSDLLTFDEQITLIDVRSPQELATYGSIPGAINIPLNDVKSAFQLSESDFRDTFFFPKPAKNSRNLVFFARGPNASSAAVEIAHRLGFKGSRQYSGGWEDYCKQTGVPLRKLKKLKEKTTPFMGRSSFDAYKTYTM